MGAAPNTRKTTIRGHRTVQFFFTNLGSLLGVIVYFTVSGRAGNSAAGVQTALTAALAVHTGYIALAAWCRELKQFDFGLWTLFALGTACTSTGAPSPILLFQYYAPALVPATFGLVALIPVLLGKEPFTMYFARKQVPPWQQRTPQFMTVNRFIALYWAGLFAVAAGLAAWAPTDWRFTALYPNLVIVAAGMIAGRWLPDIYLRFFPGKLPSTPEGVIMGMPFVFVPQAAAGARATIQFRVSGADSGNYYVTVNGGCCESFEGAATAPDLTIQTPDSIWVRIAHGELDAVEALTAGLYQVDGDLGVLAQMGVWFNGRK